MKDDYSKGVFDSLAVEIGGIKQWINIRGKKKDAPVLLVIHGGPGSTLMGMSHVYQRPWEEKYIVVNWDQRCSGKTASVSGTKTEVEITFKMMVQDTLEVIDYLRERFSREKIIILGHSWGTMLGAAVALQAPEKIAGYISTGTMVNSHREHEVVAAQLKKVYEERKDKKAMARIARIQSEMSRGTDIWKSILDMNKLVIAEGYSSIRARGIGGAFRYEVIPMLTSPDYSLADTLHFTGFNAYIPLSIKEIFNYDLENSGYEYSVPVYYINGDTDWQTPYVLAKEYAGKTVAPDTAFYTLKNCAHCWDVDAPEQMADLICGDVFNRLKKYI